MKKIIALILCISMSLGISAFAIGDMEEPEVTVKVICNSFDEEYIKNIEFDDGTKVSDYNYTIQYMPQLTRDPSYILYYFNSAMWITRDGLVSLSLNPTQRVRDSSTLRESGWNLLKNPTYGQGSNPNWPKLQANANCFYWQYICHWEYANTKEYWNIEPSRTANSYVGVVATACNP